MYNPHICFHEKLLQNYNIIPLSKTLERDINVTMTL